MANAFELILCALVGFLRSKAALQAEVLVLRHQLNILRRNSPRDSFLPASTEWSLSPSIASFRV